MGRPLRIEYPGAHYHVTARGNEQKDVFKSQRDREQFLSYLESAVVRYGAVIHAFCLMSNHYHLLLETPSGNLSQIMHHVNGAYTNYFNTKRKRSGHLFQGRFKSILVEADVYLRELSRYIHLNPVRAGMVTRPEEYRWSSYAAYIGERKGPEWLTTSLIRGYFGTGQIDQKEYQEFVEELIHCRYENPLNKALAATILGRPEFVGEIKASHIDSKGVDRDVPVVKKLKNRPSLDSIVQTVHSVFDKESLSRQASIYLCHKYSGATLKELGGHFHMGESAVSQARRRFGQLLVDDRELNSALEKLEEMLVLSRV